MATISATAAKQPQLIDLSQVPSLDAGRDMLVDIARCDFPNSYDVENDGGGYGHGSVRSFYGVVAQDVTETHSPTASDTMVVVDAIVNRATAALRSVALSVSSHSSPRPQNKPPPPSSPTTASPDSQMSIDTASSQTSQTHAETEAAIDDSPVHPVANMEPTGTAPPHQPVSDSESEANSPEDRLDDSPRVDTSQPTVDQTPDDVQQPGAISVADTAAVASASAPASTADASGPSDTLSVSCEALETLHGAEWSFPGWRDDVDQAVAKHAAGKHREFAVIFRRMKEQQKIYDDYRTYRRLKTLSELVLTYPSHEEDLARLEAWHSHNKSNDDTDAVFDDMVQGLKNKDMLFCGDRSHHFIRRLDQLQLTYDGWETDYQAAIHASCDQPRLLFPNAIHRLQQKQRVHEGNRSHWRLVQLDTLQLTYPNWEEDVAIAEEWHYQNADCDEADEMFAEVLDGMKDEQRIHVESMQETSEMSLAPSYQSPSIRPTVSMKSEMSDSLRLVGKVDHDIYAEMTSGTESSSGDSHAQSGDDEAMAQDTIGGISTASNAVGDVSKSSNMRQQEDAREAFVSAATPVSGNRRPQPSRACPSFEDGRRVNGSSSASSMSATTASGFQPAPRSGVGAWAENGTIENVLNNIDRALMEHQSKHIAIIEQREHHGRSRSSGKLSSKSSSSMSLSLQRPKTVSSSHSVASSLHDFGTCTVCQSRPTTHVFIPCGHLCVCASCGANAIEAYRRCPICHLKAENTYRVCLG